MLSPTSHASRLLPAFCALVTAGAPLSAQGRSVGARVTAVSASDCARGLTNAFALPTGEVEVDCAYASSTWSSQASNFNGIHRAKSVASSSPARSATIGQATTYAESRWEDRLVFTGGPAPAFAVLDLKLTGRLAAGADPGIVGSAGASFSLFFQVENVSAATRTYGISVTGSAGGPSEGSQVVNEVVSVVVPVDSRVFANGIGFYQVMGTSAGVVGGCCVVPDLFAVSDFSHTAAFSAVRFLDADEQDISRTVSYAFLAGTQLIPTSVVPEPGTWALLGMGLLAVGALAWRRGQHVAYTRTSHASVA